MAAKTKFTGDDNDLKEAAHILIMLRKSAKDYKRTYLQNEQIKMKKWEARADEWIEKNIKPNL